MPEHNAQIFAKRPSDASAKSFRRAVCSAEPVSKFSRMSGDRSGRTPHVFAVCARDCTSGFSSLRCFMYQLRPTDLNSHTPGGSDVLFDATIISAGRPADGSWAQLL